MLRFGNRVAVTLVAAATQLQMSGGQSSHDDPATQRAVAQTFRPGLTGGDMNLLGRSTQYDCAMRVTGDARFCAVNFQPDGPLDELGSMTGMCVAVSNCAPNPTSTPSSSGAVSAPVNAGSAPRPPGGGSCYNGLPPPCSGPIHNTHDNACTAIRAYTDGTTSGNEEVIQDRLTKADCVSGQGWSGSPYCAVNFYLRQGAGRNPVGRCMGVLPPCGATLPNSEADTARLPIDQSDPCILPSVEPISPPPSAPPPPPPLPPPPVTGVPIGQHSLICADGSLQVCADGSQHRAVFCRSDLDYALGPAVAGAVCAKDHQAACSCDCCTCADGLIPICQGEAPPDECDEAEMSTLFSDINNICCAGVDCSNGPPASCNHRCADVMTEAWHNSACQAALDAIMGATIQTFMDLCAHPTDETYTDVDDEYSCSYAELINLVLECTVAEEHDCSSTCVVHMRPFLQQCGAVMGDMISAMEPAAESFQHMVAQCDNQPSADVTPTRPTCDISNILTTCSHLDADLASASSMASLCNTPCVHLVVENFDVCNSDPSQQIRAQFGADQWQPVVMQCQQLTSTSLASQDDHCVDAMETILATVNQVCCTAGCKAGPPKSCSPSCADAFMPVRCFAP